MKNTGRKILATIVMLLVGALFGFLGVKVGKQAAGEFLSPTILIAICIAIIPAFFFVIGIHEAGHAWAGRLVGFDFRLYVVGPFLWEKTAAGWKFKWNRNLNTSGGLVLCVPTDGYNLLKRFSWYAAGGPLASLALAVVALVSQRVASMFMLPGILSQLITYLLLLIGILSALIFIATSIPVRAGGFSSDGLRIVTMLRGGNQARLEAIMLKTVGASMAGVRPAQLNTAELQEALALARMLEAPLSLYINYYCYQAAMDLNENDEAEQHLNEYILRIHNLPESLKGSVWLEAAYFYAVVRNDLTTAETHFSKYKPSPLIPLMVVYATQAALARLKQNSEDEAQYSEKARKEMVNMMDRGVAKAIADRLAK